MPISNRVIEYENSDFCGTRRWRSLKARLESNKNVTPLWCRIWIEANNVAMQPREVSYHVKQILSRLSELLEYIDAKHMFKIVDDDTG